MARVHPFDERPELAGDAVACVRLRCKAVDLHNGLVELHLPARSISAEASAVLAELFPHTEALIAKALNVELLLSAIAE